MKIQVDYCILNAYFKPSIFSMVIFCSLHLKAYKCRNCSLKLQLQQFYILTRNLVASGITNYIQVLWSICDTTKRICTNSV